MAENMTKPNFFEADGDIYCVSPAGRTWAVHYDGVLGSQEPIEVDGLPDADSIDTLEVDPDSYAEWCRRIEAVSGEPLVETAD